MSFTMSRQRENLVFTKAETMHGCRRQAIRGLDLLTGVSLTEVFPAAADNQSKGFCHYYYLRVEMKFRAIAPVRESLVDCLPFLACHQRFSQGMPGTMEPCEPYQ